MKNMLGSLAIAFSMFSKIPMPFVEWTKERMAYALCFFPLVGAVAGLAVNLAGWGLRALGLASTGWLALAAIPILLTGGIHMDGFLDVVDARASHGDRERKLEILKDPHVGAFAIAGCGVYLVLYGAALGELNPGLLPAFGGTFVLTRALSGLAVACFPKAKKDGLAAAFSKEAKKPLVCGWMGAWILLSLAWVWQAGGVKAAIWVGCGAILVFGYYFWMSKREFGGITGDLAGYFLQVCELALLAALAAAGI